MRAACAPERGATLRRRFFWTIVISLSIGLRLLALWVCWGRQQTGDAHSYIVLAEQIRAGNGMTILDPFMQRALRAAYPPLLPLIFAAIGSVVPLTLTTIAIFNTIIAAACAWSLHRLAAYLEQPQVGTLAAALYLLWPTSLALTPIAHKEGLLCLLVVAQAATLARLIRRPAMSLAIGFGVLAGLMVLTQPGLAPLPALFALAVLPHFPGRRRWLAIMVAATLAAVTVMMPWWIRNWTLFGRFVPLTTSGGASLWIGSLPSGDGTYVPPAPRFRHLDEIEASVAMGREARALIAADPLGFFAQAAGKLWRALTIDVWGASKLYWMVPTAHPRLIFWWGLAASIVHVIVLQLALVTAVMRRHWLPSVLFLAALVQILLFGIWFEFGERHRYFLTPLLILLASYGLVQWRATRTAGR